MKKTKLLIGSLIISLALSGCGTDDGKQTKEKGGTNQKEVNNLKNDEATNSDITIETSINQDDFKYGSFGKRYTIKHVESEKFTGFFPMKNDFVEWIGFDNKDNKLRFLFKDNSTELIKDGLHESRVNDTFSFKAITKDSQEIVLELNEVYSWQSNGSTYRYLTSDLDDSSGVIRIDYNTGMDVVEDADDIIKNSVDVSDLKDDSTIKNEIGDFTINKLAKSTLNDKNIDFNSENGDVKIKKIDYLKSPSSTEQTIAVTLEIDPKNDGELIGDLIFPYSNFQAVTASENENNKFYKGIKKTTTLLFKGVPDIFLEDSIILRLNRSAALYKFKNSDSINSGEVLSSTSSDLNIVPSVIEKASYSIRDIQHTSYDDGAYESDIEIEYRRPDSTDIEKIMVSNGDSGLLDLKQDEVEALIRSPYLEGFVDSGIVDYKIQLKNPNEVLKPKPLK